MSREKLTKKEIIENIFERVDLESQDVRRVVDEFLIEIKDALEKDKIIELRGFGTFEIRTRKGREKARNPKTGEIVPIKPHGVTIFRPGRALKEASWSLRDE